MVETLAPELFASLLALVGAVIIIAALLSGLIERSGLPQVAVFLGLGAILGPLGLSQIHITLQSPILHVVSVLSLVLVLFTDAVSLDTKEVRQHVRLALRVLGPGTMLSAALIAIAAKYLLALSWPAAAILGAALASTDPVMLRGLLRRKDLPAAVRQALRLESGLNDVVLLPVILVAMAFLSDKVLTGREWTRLTLNMFLLGPGAGSSSRSCFRCRAGFDSAENRNQTRLRITLFAWSCICRVFRSRSIAWKRFSRGLCCRGYNFIVGCGTM